MPMQRNQPRRDEERRNVAHLECQRSMHASPLLQPLLLLLLLACNTSASSSNRRSSAFVNVAASRTVDVTGHVARLSLSFDATGSGTAAGSGYECLLPRSMEPYLASVRLSVDKRAVEAVVTVDEDVLVVAAPASATSAAATSGTVIKVQLDVVLINALTPLPAEVTQGQKQSVVFEFPGDSVFILTPYSTSTQTTTITLPSQTKVHSRPLTPKPNSLSGSLLKLGPYTSKDIEAAESENTALRLHYELNSPMYALTNVLREYEISHWGNCAVEDHYDLVHTGANLVGGFSRASYTTSRNDAGGPSFRSLKAVLPPRASGIYYRDVIGNISTSHVRHLKSTTELEIEARYPIFGGWRTSWYQGYDVPLSSVASYNAQTNQYSLRLPLGLPFANSYAERYKVKVILPQFSSNVKFTSEIPTIANSMGERHTFLDLEFFQGRPVIVLDYEKIVSPEHDSFLTVTYELETKTLLYKPLYVSTVFFVCFLIFMVTSRIVAIGSETRSSNNRKLKSI